MKLSAPSASVTDLLWHFMATAQFLVVWERVGVLTAPGQCWNRFGSKGLKQKTLGLGF